MLRIPFEWLEFAFECFGSLSSGSNLHSNASNPFRMVRICIRMLRIPLECFKFAFECFESLSNGSNLHSNANDTINGELCLCKKSPRFHQTVSNKRSKNKLSRGCMPLDTPSLPHALHTDTYLIPNNPYNLILPPCPPPPPHWAKS